MNSAVDIDTLRSRIREIESGTNQLVPDSIHTSETHFQQQASHNLSRHSGSRTSKNANQNAFMGDADAAFKKLLVLVNARDRSTHQIRDRLSHEGFINEDIEATIEKAIELRILDDSRYARLLIESRVRQSKGSRGIAIELQQEEIDVNLIEGWPDAFQVSFDEEFNRALAFLESKPPSSKNKREGAYRKLVSRGYPINIASQVARAWFEKSQAI